jgi:hypothetical protein
VVPLLGKLRQEDTSAQGFEADLGKDALSGKEGGGERRTRRTRRKRKRNMRRRKR